MSHAVSNFHGTEFEIWAGLRPVGSTEEKIWADYGATFESHFFMYSWTNFFLKFMLPKKAIKIDEIFTVYLTLFSKCQIDGEDFINFCGLLRKHEL